MVAYTLATKGEAYEYVDAQDVVHLLQPLVVHRDTAPWSVQMSFPRSVAKASARELLNYTLIVSLLCALVTAIVLVSVVGRLTLPLRNLSKLMAGLASAPTDLSIMLQVQGHDELATIGSSFNQFVAKIHSVLKRVRSSVDSVSNASTEIAHGNQDLSNRTEQQASALEQAAAFMEELGATVRQNADSARQPNQLALDAAGVAAQGGEAMGQVVHTMKGVNDSSKKIADIISVIDGIAFHTSVERVDQGTAMADRAGINMAEVASSIRRVASIMAEISAASNDQASGVSQVSEAVKHMDQATQQNAALVEQMAAAAANGNAFERI